MSCKSTGLTYRGGRKKKVDNNDYDDNNNNNKSKSNKSKRNSIKNDDVDVLTEDDIDKMLAVLKKYIIVLGSVQADWCGHCKTYKPIWENYKNTKGRKIPMINVNEKMLSHTPFAKANIDGFPSTVVYSHKDGSFASFNKENGESTNSIPNARDPKAMNSLLTTDPSKLQQVTNNNASAFAEVSGASVREDRGPDSATIQEGMMGSLTDSARAAIKNKNANTINMDIPSPPITTNDSLPVNEASSTLAMNASSPSVMTNTGGSLYQRLLRVASGKRPTTRRRGKQLRRTARHIK